jgi:hypothetical protein
MEKGYTRNITCTPHKKSNTASDSSEDLENRLTQLKNQVDEMSASMLKEMDLSHSQEYFKKEMEMNVDENQEHMENKMLEL